MEQIIIIGGGPAGLAAAIYAARDGLNPLVFAGTVPGGQPMLTSYVENYPGHEKIMGPDLVSTMRRQAVSFGARFVDKDVAKVDFSKRPFKVYGRLKEGIDAGYEDRSKKMENNLTSTLQLPNSLPNPSSNFLLANSVIITTGAKALWLNLPSEQRLIGKGVSACANCDGFFFRDKVVAVVGGGDTALEEATSLTKYAKKVYIIHRRDHFRASKVMQDKVFASKKIEMIWNAQVTEVLGKERVEGIKLNVQRLPAGKAGLTLNELKLDGLFVAIGYKPDTDLFKGQVEMDERGYIITAERAALENYKSQITNNKTNSKFFGNWNLEFGTYRQATSVKGVFAGGDCIDPHYKQLATAIGSGVAAAVEADRWLEHK